MFLNHRFRGGRLFRGDHAGLNGAAGAEGAEIDAGGARTKPRLKNSPPHHAAAGKIEPAGLERPSVSADLRPRQAQTMATLRALRQPR